jgi:hypothetical protein
MRLTLCARCAPYLNRRVEDMNSIASGLHMIDLKEVPSAFSMLAKVPPSQGKIFYGYLPSCFEPSVSYRRLQED